MTVNGKTFDKSKLDNLFNAAASNSFEQVQIKVSQDTYEQNKFENLLKQANIAGDIPRRFHKTMLGDFPLSFIETARKFSLQKDNDGILLVCGPVGVGKTSVLAGIMHERVINGLDCGTYFSMRFLLPMLRTSRSFSAKESELALLNRFSSVPFLCFDELGTSENIVEESNFLRTVIAARYDNCLPSVFATNLDSMKFKLLLVGKNMSDFKDKEGAISYLRGVEPFDPIINRIKAITIVESINGVSHRGELL